MSSFLLVVVLAAAGGLTGAACLGVILVLWLTGRKGPKDARREE